jgi:polar amino acid transport system substrate-binding protein
MKFIATLLFSLFFLASSVYAQEDQLEQPASFLPSAPLKVGIGGFYPPFIMSGANQELFGFDIEMMSNLCQRMNRTCTFQPMRFRQLIPALVNNQIDIAVNAMAITVERSKLVDFSMPYLLSYSRFLTNHTYSGQQFSLQLLAGKRIGVGADSVFNKEIREMNITNPNIVEYRGTHNIEEMIEALSTGKIDFVLLDNPSALYWTANVANIAVIGKPIMYGYGLGIAVNQANMKLLQAINKALLQYEYTNDYLKDYNRYIMQF